MKNYTGKSAKFFMIPVLFFIILSLPHNVFGIESLNPYDNNITAEDLYQDSLKADDLNKSIHALKGRWIAKSNYLSVLSLDSKRKHLGAVIDSIPAPSTHFADLKTITDIPGKPGPESLGSPATAAISLPAYFDWRHYNGKSYVTPVKDQGQCGSCWAFSSTAALESRILIDRGMHGLDVDLAEQILVTLANAGSCGGGDPFLAADFFVHTGLAIEACYPYTATNGSPSDACLNWDIDTYKIKNYVIVNEYPPTATPFDIKRAIYEYGPIVGVFDVYEDFYYYHSGIYAYTSGAYCGGHAILIVGWDDKYQCFIVKNSWGDAWGEDGYFRIAYTEMTDCVEFASYAVAYHASTMKSKTVPLADFYISSPNINKHQTMAIEGVIPHSVRFQDTSTSPKSVGPLTSWHWDFGDGKHSTLRNPTHIYKHSGTYTVSLTAGNAEGTDTATYVDMISLYGPAVQSLGGSVDSWAWSFGDGATSTE